MTYLSVNIILKVVIEVVIVEKKPLFWHEEGWSSEAAVNHRQSLQRA